MTATNKISLFVTLPEEESASVSGGDLSASDLAPFIGLLGGKLLDGAGLVAPTDISYERAKAIFAKAAAEVGS